MSVSRGCAEVEYRPGEWYCIVAVEEYDFDFNGLYNLYGPAETAEAAHDMMRRSVANPGGGSEYGHENVPPHLARLVEEELQQRREREGRARLAKGEWPSCYL